jgi:hypothetical protein
MTKNVKIKYALLILIISFIISTIFYFINNLEFIAFINTLFLLGLILTLLGVFMYIKEKGFFRLPSFGFKKTLSSFSKKNTHMVHQDNKDITFEDYVLKKQEPYFMTLPFITSGLLLLFLSFILSFI